MNAAAQIGWLARHELSLSWRDFMMMMTAGRPSRQLGVIAVLVIAIIFLHAIAWVLLAPAVAAGTSDIGRYLMVSGMIALAFTLMASQAMESITRIFYSRSDLDLVLTSPVNPSRIFAVRLGAIVFSTSMLSILLAAPAINVMSILETPRWLLAYPFALCMGAMASVLALALTLLMFRTMGARRTRTAAQIAAAVIGALFVIGIQLAAIASLGTISRMSFLQSGVVREMAPEPSSLFWLPARAAMGDVTAFGFVLVLAILAYVAAHAIFAAGMAEKVLVASGLSESGRTSRRRTRPIAHGSIAAALRHKEWKLLARDHWLISQTLMQVFYLAPPAFMLWQGFGAGSAVPTVIVPVLVMASGQLAGGLAWLAISGEDAPQLVATAPIPRRAIIRAKVEAVLAVVAMFVAPILLVLAIYNPWNALVAAAGILAGSASATAIQLWFRSQAKRSSFRRRQTSSRVATFAEAFSSISWAGAAALFANHSNYGMFFAGVAFLVLVIARAIRPNPKDEFLH